MGAMWRPRWHCLRVDVIPRVDPGLQCRLPAFAGRVAGGSRHVVRAENADAVPSKRRCLLESKWRARRAMNLTIDRFAYLRRTMTARSREESAGEYGGEDDPVGRQPGS